MTATTRRTLILGTSLLGPLATFGGRGARAASDAAEIDRDATRAFQQLLREDRRAAALAPKAAGTLIFPRVVKAGFILGGQGGKGALRVGGRTQGYYTMVDRGVAATVNSTTPANDVVAFPFDQKGLMGGISTQGSKIATYNPNA